MRLTTLIATLSQNLYEYWFNELLYRLLLVEWLTLRSRKGTAVPVRGSQAYRATQPSQRPVSGPLPGRHLCPAPRGSPWNFNNIQDDHFKPFPSVFLLLRH